MISPLLTTDDAVMLRTATSRWNEGIRYGALGYAFFMMLKLDQLEKKWHYGSDGNRVCTMFWRQNPIVDSIRRRGLHLPQEATPPMRQGEVETTSFGDAVKASSGNQVAETQVCRADSTWGYPELADENASISSGSPPPDLGEMWRYGRLKSPDWDTEMDVCSVEEEVCHLRHVTEGPLWVSVRVFLVSHAHGCKKVEHRWAVQSCVSSFS